LIYTISDVDRVVDDLQRRLNSSDINLIMWL